MPRAVRRHLRGSGVLRFADPRPPGFFVFDMIIGLLHFELLVHDAESLKDKRRVVKSVKDRLHREHLAAVAEVGALDVLNRAVLAAAVVGTDGARIGATLDRISEKLRGWHGAELGFTRRELIRPGRDDMPEAERLDTSALAAEMLGYADGGPGGGGNG